MPIPYSKTLERLMKDAVNCYAKGEAVTTEDRFLLVVSRAAVEEHETNEELKEVYDFLLSKKYDFASTEKKLVEQLEKEGELWFWDDWYFMDKTIIAETEEVMKGEKELKVLPIIKEIFREPSDKLDFIAEYSSDDSVNIAEQAESVGNLLKKIVSNKPQQPQSSAQKKETKKVQNKEETKPLSDEPSVTASLVDILVEKAKGHKKKLKDIVVGQDHAIDVLIDAWFHDRFDRDMGKKREKPTYILFAGPPGVGKTMLAEKTAKVLGINIKRFDMSGFSDKDAVNDFCGFPKTYSNSKEGVVTGYVMRNPTDIIFFDELEKAHPKVIHLFLQMLDAGYVRDVYHDKNVSFSDTIIIMTTNAGRGIYEERDEGDFSALPRKSIIKALRKDKNPDTGEPFFPAAICSRFDAGNVVMFNHMNANSLCEISDKVINKTVEEMKKSYGIEMTVAADVHSAILFAEGGAADARTITARSDSFIKKELLELFELVSSTKGSGNVNDIRNISIDVDLSGTDNDICRLFKSVEKSTVLLFADKSVVTKFKKMAPSIEVVSAQTVEQAIKLLRKRDIDFTLIDFGYGADVGEVTKLNMEDVDSVSREFIKFLREKMDRMPMYFLDTNKIKLTEEEISAFKRNGMRGVVNFDDEIDACIQDISAQIYRQRSMLKLARENKVIKFETSQSCSADGSETKITLFDFEADVALDPDDLQTMLGAPSRENVLFKDVIGAEDAKDELKGFVNYLENPKQYIDTGSKIPKGVILYGPPGTGKTMLAKAMASEAKVTFISAQGNQFRKKHVGEGAEAVAQIFRSARKYAPTVLFIDEIDAIAKARTGGDGSSDEVEATLTRLLTEMDGFSTDQSRPVFVIAATNFNVTPGTPKSLDEALMRRFDHKVYVDLPTKAERIKFLKKKLEGNPFLAMSETIIENIASRSPGMSLAILDNIVERSIRIAVKLGKTKVDDAVFEEAFESNNGGEVKEYDDCQLERVARHEAGHAFLCYQAGETPTYLTVVARGDHGGYMQHADNEGKAIYTKDELLARIRTSLGGRAAELVYYGPQDGISTGAIGDLRTASSHAYNMVCSYGMCPEFGLSVIDEASKSAFAGEIRAQVNKILEEQMTLAVELIEKNRKFIDALVKELITNGSLTSKQIDKILAKSKK